jgi:hypothetical protein
MIKNTSRIITAEGKSLHHGGSYLLHVVLVFREDSQNELSLFIGLECGGNNAVHTRRQLKATVHLT